MDWTTRSSSGDNGKTKNDKTVVENGKMGSWKKRKCRDEIAWGMEKLGKIESELGISI